MTPSQAPAPIRPVLWRGHFAVALLAALLLLLPGEGLAAPRGKGGPPPGKAKSGQQAGDDDDDDDDDDTDRKDGGRKGAKKSEDERLLEAAAGEWKSGSHASLAARFPSKRKVSLRLPDAKAGSYRAEQAEALLKEYFADRTFSVVKVRRIRDLVGTFDVEYVRSSDRRKVKATLILTLGTENGKRVLVGARESS